MISRIAATLICLLLLAQPAHCQWREAIAFDGSVTALAVWASTTDRWHHVESAGHWIEHRLGIARPPHVVSWLEHGAIAVAASETAGLLINDEAALLAAWLVAGMYVVHEIDDASKGAWTWDSLGDISLPLTWAIFKTWRNHAKTHNDAHDLLQLRRSSGAR